MHIIITGGAGFIGSHLTQLLLEKGATVTIVDNLSTGSQDNIPSDPAISFHRTSIQDWDASQIKQPADAIIHLAANASVQASWRQPLQAHNDNLTSTLKVATIAKELKIPRIINASSAAVYGTPVHLPIDEAHPCEPLSPYGAQKLWGEKYLEQFASQYGFSCHSLRLFNVFGPGQNPASHYSGVITLFVNAMRANENIRVFGDGKQTRDFVYVKDVAQGFYQALDASLTSGMCESLNIGSQHQTSLLQLIDTLKELIPDWTGNVVHEDNLPGDVRDSLCSAQKAAKDIHFNPATSLKEGLKSLLNG